jgi:hypothetical protein
VRRLALIAFLPLVAVACSSSSKPAASSSTTTTTVAKPTTPTQSPGPARLSAFVLSVDPAHHHITIDPMQFLTGPAATAAYHKANPHAPPGGPDNDYYIVNPHKDAIITALSPGAGARVVQAGGTVHTTPVPVPIASLSSYPNLSQHPFWLTLKNGAVTEVDEQFVP